MNKTFIETIEFTEWVKEYMSDDALSDLQQELRNNPETGSVMPGCGGLRKMRVADARRGKGKRGGVRVIYLHVAEADVIFLMDIYGKAEQEDLSADQKKVLKRLAEGYKRAAVHGGGGVQAGDIMKSPTNRKPLFERLKAGLEEGIRHAKGEITLKTTTLEVPDRPPEVGAEELTKLRLASGMSQAVFARLLNVSTKTVQSWEQGHRKPSQAALRLIQVFRHDPSGLLEVAGMSGPQGHGRPVGSRPRPFVRRADRDSRPLVAGRRRTDVSTAQTGSTESDRGSVRHADRDRGRRPAGPALGPEGAAADPGVVPRRAAAAGTAADARGRRPRNPPPARRPARSGRRPGRRSPS